MYCSCRSCELSQGSANGIYRRRNKLTYRFKLHSGRVADDSSKEVVKNIEGLKTGRGDKPIDEVKVEASGVL